MGFNGVYRVYPLVMTNIADWKITIEIVDLSIENRGFVHSYVKLPEGMDVDGSF